MTVKSLRGSLKGIPSPHYRSAIRKEAKRRGYQSGRMNASNREILAGSIFRIENDLESRGDGHPHDPQVVAMRTARSALYDDLGWNEAKGSQAPRPRSNPANPVPNA